MLVSLLNASDPYASADAGRKERTKVAQAAPFAVPSAIEKGGGPARRARRGAGKPKEQRAAAAENTQAGLFAEAADEEDFCANLPEDALDGQALCALLKETAV